MYLTFVKQHQSTASLVFYVTSSCEYKDSSICSADVSGCGSYVLWSLKYYREPTIPSSTLIRTAVDAILQWGLLTVEVQYNRSRKSAIFPGEIFHYWNVWQYVETKWHYIYATWCGVHKMSLIVVLLYTCIFVSWTTGYCTTPHDEWAFPWLGLAELHNLVINFSRKWIFREAFRKVWKLICLVQVIVTVCTGVSTKIPSPTVLWRVEELERVVNVIESYILFTAKAGNLMHRGAEVRNIFHLFSIKNQVGHVHSSSCWSCVCILTLALRRSPGQNWKK